MPKATRTGRATSLTLDRDALLILRELAESKKTMGRTVSSLLREELARREERAKLRRAVLTALDDGGLGCID
jgi:hypothetical protein